MAEVVIFFLVICAFIIGGAVLAWKRNDDGAISCLVVGIAIMFFLISRVSVMIPSGMPSTTLEMSEYPGIRYEVLKVVGEFDSKSKVDIIILNEKCQREYHTISREIIVNKEIPSDTKELTAIQTVKGPRIVMGPFEKTFELDSEKQK